MIFDINRYAAKSPMIASQWADRSAKLIEDATLPTTVSLLTNRSPETREVHLQKSPSLTGDITDTTELNAAWPAGVFSLSHVALPFAPDDPVYGRVPPGQDDFVYLGNLAIKGERGLLRLPPDWLLRLRHNPFHDFLEQRTIEWLDAASRPGR